MEEDNHLQNALKRGYVSSLEGISSINQLHMCQEHLQSSILKEKTALLKLILTKSHLEKVTTPIDIRKFISSEKITRGEAMFLKPSKLAHFKISTSLSWLYHISVMYICFERSIQHQRFLEKMVHPKISHSFIESRAPPSFLPLKMAAVETRFLVRSPFLG